MLFAPLWWLWPSPDLLLVTQAIAIALGALPVYWLARKHLASERAGLGFALTYLVYPPTTWLALNEFHPGGLAMPALLYAFWYLDEDRLAPFAAFALFAAMCREDVPLVLAGFGLWYAFAHGRRAAGGAIAAAGVVWTGIAAGFVIPHFGAGQSTFSGRYSEARAALFDPPALLRLTFDHAGLHYLLDLVLPLAGLCLLAPVALAALPALALNLLSATPTQTSIHFHYTAAEIPPLIAAAVLGGARVRDRLRLPVASVALGAALIGNYVLGADSGVERAARRRDASGTRGHRDLARSRRRRRLEAHPAACRRQRDELARRSSLGAATRPELPVHPGCDLGRGRRVSPRLCGPARAAADGRAGRVAAAQPGVAARVRARRRARVPPRAAALERNRLT